MRIRPILFAMALVAPAAGAVAQEAPQTDLSILPQACRAAIVPPEQAMPGSDDSHDNMAGAPRPASEAQVSNAGEAGSAVAAQTETMRALDRMHGPMMAAAGIADADLAFNCGMLAHHQGAIDMARVELKYGKDPDSRKMAEAIIEAQTREISEMSARIVKLAQR